jgi:hypothetical protein
VGECHNRILRCGRCVDDGYFCSANERIPLRLRGSSLPFCYPRQSAIIHSIGFHPGNRQSEAKMATYSIGDLDRREILKMSAVLAGSLDRARFSRLN